MAGGGHGRGACVVGVCMAGGRGHVWLRGVRGPPVPKRAIRILLKC